MVDKIDSLESDVFDRDCTSRPVVQHVASRWGILALLALLESPYRFSALRRRVEGVSERMLSQTLQTLERDGMVHRQVHETIPPNVEYSLTDLGTEIAQHLLNLVECVQSRLPEITEAQQQYERR